ncbi:MAG: hypothetical protein D3918_06180, partial [Candidatus Electrothrix sp. AX2]|nr:hypothetical protein [Candidatus Electrothrix gigas]
DDTGDDDDGSGTDGNGDEEGNHDEEDEDDDCQEDCNNECKPDAKKSPVYVKSGNLELKFIDFGLADIGPPLHIVRIYNSQDYYNGPFGHGWMFNLAARLVRTADHNGEYIIIRKPSGKRLKFIHNNDGTYSPAAKSVTDTLIELPDGSFTLNCKTCSRTFIRPTYHFDTQGKILSISDNKDNYLNFTYDGQDRLRSVVSTAVNRNISITYGTNGKISQISDSFGREWLYSYNKQEDLIKVTDPLGYTVRYQYDTNHKLLSVADKNNRLNPVVTYDAKSRIKTYGAGNELYTYDYFSGYTTKTDSLGNVFTFYYDQNGNVIKSVLPDGSEVLTYINQDVRPTRRVDAQGNAWLYTYNEFGQILTETDPLGYATVYTYDPRFQKIKTKTDPRGATWTYQYDDIGNLIKIVNPLRCETTMTYNAAGQILSKTDGLGNTVSYTYDTSGNLTKMTDPLGNEEISTYDALGRLISKKDQRGNTWNYTYDILGRLTEIENPDGGRKLYTYDGNGNKISETDEKGNTTSFSYDVLNRLIKKTDPLGNSTEYAYDAVGNITAVVDMRGNTVTRTYNERYQVISETDPLGNTTSYTYDASGNRLSKTDARGNAWTYTYDAMDRLLTEADPLGNTKSYGYDAAGNRIKVTDPEGQLTYFTYDLVGNVVRSLVKIGDDQPEPDSDDIVTIYTYDCLGKKISETNALGQTTTWTYDFRGKTLSETNSLGEVKIYTYDANGNKLTYTTVTGNVLSYTYDKLNRVITVGDTTGLFESYEYDAVGNKTKITKSNGDSTTTDYTPFNKPAKVTDALGNAATYSYDNNYNLLQAVDRLGKVTVNSYDKLNRLYQVTDPLGNISVLTFDEVGNMVKMKDAKGNETVYAYDAANRLLSVTYADGHSKSVIYNAAGKVVSKTDRNGNVLTYTRDDLYRITQRNYPDGSTYSYTYDKLGRLLTAVNAYGTVSINYDAAGRITGIDQNGTQITYSHNVSARTRTINYPSGKQFVETYTLRDKIAQIDNLSDTANVVTYTYDALGRPVGKVFGNGVTTGYLYNKNSRISGVSYKKSDGSDILGFQYTYDKEGNRLNTLDTVHSERSEQYSYDPVQRLTSFKQGQADQSNQIPSPQFAAEYELDPLGNSLKVTQDGVAQERTVNAMNQYTAVGGNSLLYDSNGNLIDDGSNLYTYDYENQLIKITRKSDAAVIASFTIDALNRRVQKTAGGVTTEYIYDDSRIIEERVGAVTTASYVYGNMLDEVILMNRGGSTSYFHTDALGSVIALTDSSGNVAETYQYDAYGRVKFFNGSGSQISDSAKNNPYLFTGRRYDEEAGIYYYRARCYHPGLGRFLNQDPKGFIDGMNLYEYAMSNPLRYIDPRGTSIKKCTSHTITQDVGRIKRLIPSFLSRYLTDGSISISYQKCRACCQSGNNKGNYATSKELSVAASWTGDTGYIMTPWGIAIKDNWLFHGKGFVGVVAQVSWGLAGNLSGGYDGCDEKGFGQGCVKGSITVEALLGTAVDSNKDSSIIKAYVSGGINGTISLCLKYQGRVTVLELGGEVSGAIKGTVGFLKYSYDRTFIELSGSYGPAELAKF